MPASQLAEFKARCDDMVGEMAKRMANPKNKAANKKLLKQLVALLKADYLDKPEAGHDPWQLAMVTDGLSIPPEVRNTRLCELDESTFILAALDITCEGRTFQMTIFMFEHNRDQFLSWLNEMNNKENIGGEESTVDISVMSNHTTPKRVLNDTLVNVQRKPPRPVKEEELRMQKVKLILASESGTPLIVNTATKLQLEGSVKNVLNNEKA